MKFVDVTNDIAFRKIFANERDTKVLLSFLNAVISLPQNERIVDVSLISPYQLPKLSRGKSTIVDVKAKDGKGNVFIVEMQIAEVEFFHKRILYYTSQSYAAQLGKGGDYSKLQPVYFIGILEFNIGDNPNYFSRHKVLDVETNEHIIRDVEFNFIELPKFNKTLDQLETGIDQWTFFIKNAESLNLIPDNITDEGLKEAYIEADRHNWTQSELENYDYASMREGDEINRISLAEKRAEARGEAQGEARGEIRGEARGEAKGEIKNNIKIIKQAVLMGLSLADISKLTRLPEEQIQNIINNPNDL